MPPKTTEAVLSYARTFLGVPYVYGGKNRLTGLDCSGLVGEVLKAFGLVRHAEELSAQMLYDRFSEQESAFPLVPTASLVFFGKSKREINHVAIAIDSIRMIEAGGGDHTTTDFHTAARQGAMVRERPLSLRRDRVAVCLPPWPKVEG